MEGGEAGEGSGELAVEGDFVAEEELGRAGGFVGAAEGEDGADGGGSDVGRLESHVAIEGGLLEAPDTELTPACGDHGLDESELGGGARLMLVNEVGEEVVEAAGGFFGEDDGGGEESVAEAVAGGVEFAFRGDGALGAGAVGAGGGELFRRSHSG